MSTRSFYLSTAFYLAEAGIEDGLYAINSSGFTAGNGWALVSGSATDYWKSITSGFTYAQGSGAIYVRVDNAISATPIVTAMGVITIPKQPKLIKQLRIGTSVRKLWANGMVAKGTITFSNKAEVDSYDSALGAWNSATNRSDKAMVATASTAVDSVVIDSKAEVYGYVATGGTDPDVGKDGRIYGATTPGSTLVDSSRVRKDFSANIPDAVAPGGAAISLGNINANTHLPRVGDLPASNGRFLYTASAVTLNSTAELFIEAPVDLIVTGTTAVSSSGSVTVGGLTYPTANLNLYAAGTVNFSAKGLKNYAGNPSKFTLYGTAPTGTTQTITFGHDADFYGMIFAPNANISLANKGDVYGAVIAKSISLSNKAVFHYDVQLANTASDTVRLSAFCELTQGPSSGQPFARDNRAPFAGLF